MVGVGVCVGTTIVGSFDVVAGLLLGTADAVDDSIDVPPAVAFDASPESRPHAVPVSAKTATAPTARSERPMWEE